MNLNILSNHIPNEILLELNEAVKIADLTTSLRMAHFLSQCHHESAGFRVLEENLNYSAKGLLAVFPKYFKTETDAKKYERNPEMIANYVYANRIGNGDTNSGDGWKYRGRGCIQITGAVNYLLFQNFIGQPILSNPDLVKQKYPLTSAAWFWRHRKLNIEADKGIDNVPGVTKLVNGGFNGLEERKTLFDKYFKLIS